MTAAVDSLVHEYTRRYVGRDAGGITQLCLCPFLAIREGIPIHLADRTAVRDHFTTIIEAYRQAGYASFSPVAIDTRELGEHACGRRCAGTRERRSRQPDDISHACDPRWLALPFVHESLLSPRTGRQRNCSRPAAA